MGRAARRRGPHARQSRLDDRGRAGVRQASHRVAYGGVLAALPMLLREGLLGAANRLFRLPAGFYGLTTILLFVACMTLARVRNPESLRHQAPGEWGAILGLDRCPETKTLHRKLKLLTSAEHTVRDWQSTLARPEVGQGARTGRGAGSGPRPDQAGGRRSGTHPGVRPRGLEPACVQPENPMGAALLVSYSKHSGEPAPSQAGREPLASGQLVRLVSLGDGVRRDARGVRAG